jgi:hypothetical protein
MENQQTFSDIEYGKRKLHKTLRSIFGYYGTSCSLEKARGTNTPLLFSRKTRTSPNRATNHAENLSASDTVYLCRRGGGKTYLR